MARILRLFYVLPVLLLAGCATPEERAAAAQEEITEKRMELIEQHQDCVKDAKGDQQKIDACQHYLKEAEALR